MSELDLILLRARLERIADYAEPRLAGFYAAVSATAIIVILPTMAGAIGRLLS